MNTEQYDMWIKSRQSTTDYFDITDTVMKSIMQQDRKESLADKAANHFLAYFNQAKTSVRACILVSGALAGALRMLFVVYYALFT